MSEFKKYIEKGKRAYLIGIGGVSMSPLAEVLKGMGVEVSGSDMSASEKTEHLTGLGISVHIGHRAENIEAGYDFVVRTAAARDDNPEVARARALGIPVFERADAWGAIMQDYENAICIAGTHGKTTTTSMCTHILMAAQVDPTVMIGGTLPLLKAGHRVGKGDTIVLESCEYHDAFLSFYPTVAVVLDIEEDHLDYFENLEQIQNSFRDFASRVPMDGHIVANADDANTMSALAPLNRELCTYGLGEGATLSAREIQFIGSHSEFEIWYEGEYFTKVTLKVPGLHNVRNALAAAASCICLGISAKAVAEGLCGFGGVERRFQYKGECNGADVYDDYAHHPGELEVLLDAVEHLPYERAILIFQPHTYTRTVAFFDDFVRELRRPTLCYLAEIYAARETNTTNISSAMLAERIDGAVFCASFADLEEQVRSVARDGDIILTVGAGDVYKIGESLVD